MYVTITDSWDFYLEQFEEEKRDIYFEEVYVKRYATNDSEPLCIVCKEEQNIVLMPFLRNKIEEYYDFETPYGYGGPIANTDDKVWISAALKEMQRYFEKNNYVCGFVRFHPLLENALLCDEVIHVIFDRKTVFINTEPEEDVIWKEQITSKNRNMIRKAEKNELSFNAEYNFESIDKFVKLYNATMQRLQADEFYYFDKKYYDEIVELFEGKAFLGTVLLNEEMICGAIFFYDGPYGHYHLEGSNHIYSGLAANNYLLWNVAKELHKLDVKKFHLGGGYDSSQDNSLLKFKKSFTNNMADFYIGKWIFNQEVYDKICKEWEMNNPSKAELYRNRLLKYRY